MTQGNIIQATLSTCCNSSVSVHYGKMENGKYIPYHYTCNNCGKLTEAYKKDMWLITDKLKYKPINN